MGASNTKTKDKSEIQIKKQLQETKKQLQETKTQIVRQTIDDVNILMSTTQHNQQLALQNDDVHDKNIQILQTAKEQLQRQGNPLIKSDLIAIIIALDTLDTDEKDIKINRLKLLNVSDLIVLIRCLIYNPNRYMNINTSQPSMTAGENNYSINNISPSAPLFVNNILPSAPPFVMNSNHEYENLISLNPFDQHIY